jgi:hypothetical protein
VAFLCCESREIRRGLIDFPKVNDGFWGHHFLMEIEDQIYGLLHRYLFPLLVVGAVLPLIDFLPLPAKILQLTSHLLILLALLLAVFFLTQGALLFLRSLAKRYEAVRNIKGPIEIVTEIIVVAVGGMIILEDLEISLTPLITTLRIESLAIAIALQETLGNFLPVFTSRQTTSQGRPIRSPRERRRGIR